MAIHTEVTIDINAPPERVWDVMTDVERWPEWTASIKQVNKLTDGPLAVGSKARIAQPKVPPVVWTVTSIEPGRFFEWENSSPAMKSVAEHLVEPAGEGTRVTLSIEQSGPSTAVLGWWLRRINKKYLEMERQGLKARLEAHNGYAI